MIVVKRSFRIAEVDSGTEYRMDVTIGDECFGAVVTVPPSELRPVISVEQQLRELVIRAISAEVFG